jgi:hypothetical protein
MNPDVQQSEPKDDAANFDSGPPEIDQQAHMEACSAKVVDALCFVDSVQARRRLHFDHDAMVHDQVRKVLTDDLCAKPHVDRRLLVDLEPFPFNLDP